MGRWAVVLVPGALLFFFPLPGLNAAQAQLLGIFVGTIIALVAQPVRMGVSVLAAMALLALTRTLPPAKILSGFSNLTVWLVVSAFLFARAVTPTGFGTRVAYFFIERFARNPLSLGYALSAADLTLAPFIPSDTARGGGVIYPITRSVAMAFGSEPGPTARRMGAYLVLVAFHATYTASAMFLTGMAANPLIAEFAMKIGHVDLTWGRWFLAAIVPGLLSLILVPQLIYRMCRPEIRDTGAARELARKELARMGRMQRDERRLVLILAGVMAGWVTSPWHGLPNTFVAVTGVAAILLARVLTWEDLLSEQKAWDALIWFAGLVMMADQLQETGVVQVLSAKLFGVMGGWPWLLVLFVLVTTYCYIHYMFAGMTAQVTALYPGFLAAAIAGGVPAMVAALPLGFFSNLNAAMTHYGTGSAPVYFGGGYVSQGDWWRIGFLISVLNLVLWMGIGMWWWKLVGLW
jgi:DASS family divalent anion:Na+ symporter